jgi:hypothetical protein
MPSAKLCKDWESFFWCREKKTAYGRRCSASGTIFNDKQTKFEVWKTFKGPCGQQEGDEAGV